MRYDFLENARQSRDSYNWVLALPLYQTIYNTGYHRTIGIIELLCNNFKTSSVRAGTSPFKVFFGREANYNLYPQVTDVNSEISSIGAEPVNEVIALISSNYLDHSEQVYKPLTIKLHMCSY